MADNSSVWLKRAKELLSQQMDASELVPFAISLITATYGPRSPQLDAFNQGLAQISKTADGASNAYHHQGMHAHGAIRNVVAEIESGLIENMRAQVAGEVLSELVGLGKEVLQGGSDAAKNVSAVLIAAAFEDIMRRMGSELAGVVGRPKLEDVLIALKNGGITKGGEVGVAQSFLKFRNDSLHADWVNVTRVQVEACTAFIEAMLLKHFS
jgi:hypothetical protein